MNILLTTSAAPKYSPFFTSEKRMPIGIGFLISVLRNGGHKVFFIDNYLYPSDFLETDFLDKNRIDFVGIYANTICYRDTYQMFYKLESLRQQKKWSGKIIVGGPHTSVALGTIPQFVDYVVQGEGEKVILDILEGKTQRIVTAERIKDLDSLPRPAWDYFVKLPYMTEVEWFPEKPVFSMNTSRGCPFNCTFCSVGSIWGKQYRAFSPERIVDDIAYLIDTYGVKGIYFREDNFTLNKERTNKFCDLLITKGIKIKWACETRVNALDKDLIELMYKAGCRAFYVGVESGSQRILDFMKKGITLDQIRQVFKWCHKVGIKPAASFVVNVPTETLEERSKTVRFSEEIRPSVKWINIFVGIPRSEMYQYVLDHKLDEYIDDRGLVYLKGHDQLVDQFYGGVETAKIPKTKGKDGFVRPVNIPKVSVIMSVYNGGRYLRKAIDSILNQTFQDFEFIIIDDASTDSTSDMLSQYRDDRIRVYRNPHQMGVYKSVNFGLKRALGEYIARMDADDISLPQRLERQKKFLDENHNYALVGSRFYIMDESGQILAEEKLPLTNEEIQKRLLVGNCFGQGTVMFRRDCVEKLGFYNEQFKYAADYDLWLRMSEQYELCNLNEFLCKWRRHCKGISQAHRAEQDRFAEMAKAQAAKRRMRNLFQNLSKEQQEFIAYLETELEEKQDRAEKDSHIAALEATIHEKELALSRIYNSSGWKALLVYYKWRDIIFRKNCRTPKTTKSQNICQNEKHKREFFVGIDDVAGPCEQIRNCTRRLIKRFLPKKIQICIKLAIFWFFYRNKNKKHKIIINTKKPFISIVIPVYNHATFLRQSLESTLNQDYDNYEVVAVDDFSTESEVREILSEFSISYKKLRVFYNKTNIGISETLNRAIINARGDYIAFLDCDDFLPNYAIKRAAAAISENKSKRYFYSSRTNVDATGKEIEKVSFIDREQKNYLKELLKGMFTDHLKIVRKDCFLEVGLLDNQYRFAQDYEFALRCAFKYPTGFAYINDNLYFHRVHPEQMSSKKSDEQKRFALRAKDTIRFKINIRRGQSGKKVSIVILSFYKKEHTIRCINSIKETVNGNNYEIILFDNGSSKDTVDLLHKNFSNDNKIRMFLSTDNLGCAGGRKKAISYADGDYIITLDNDIIVTQGWIEELILRVEEDPKIAGACCKVIFPDFKIQYNGGGAIIRDGLVDFSLIDAWKSVDDITTMRKCDCDWIPSGATIYKKEIYEKVSLCEDYKNAYEDNDFSFAVRNIGYRLVNCPTAKVIHNHVYYDRKGAFSEPEYMTARYDRGSLKHSAIAFYKRHGLVIKNE